MDVESLANPAVLKQPVYEPGKPIEYVARELGLDPDSIIKLASNENPFGPSPKAISAARKALKQGQLYPDGGCVVLRQKLAKAYQLTPDQFVVGNGSNELIELLGHVFLRPGDEVVMGDPAFVVYKLVTLLFGATPVEVPLHAYAHDLSAMARAITPRTRLVFVASLNNPTGRANSNEELLAFARSVPDHVVCVFDEAYCEYLENPPDIRPLLKEGRKVIALRTFSKIYGLAALRVGYSYSSPALASLLQRVRQPFNVNAIGQAAAAAALSDRKFTQLCAEENRAGLAQLETGLRALNLEVVPSVGNFILVRVGPSTGSGRGAAGVFDALQRRGIIVRPMASYRMPEWLRITVGTSAQNARLLSELKQVL